MTGATAGTSKGGGAGAAKTGTGTGSGSCTIGAGAASIICGTSEGAGKIGGGTGRNDGIGGGGAATTTGSGVGIGGGGAATTTGVIVGISVGMESGFFKSAVSLRKESAETDLGLGCAEALTAMAPKAGGKAVTGFIPCASANSDIEAFFSHSSHTTKAQDCFKLD